MAERAWHARLRWRRMGAWRAPVLAVLVVVEAALLGPLPISGPGTGFVPGLLLATFFNLVAVAVAAPLLSRALRRRRRDWPKVVADDRASVATAVVVCAALLAGGLIHRPARIAAEREFSALSKAVRDYVRAHEPGYRARLADADVVREGEALYRSCVPGSPRLCLLIDTSSSPPGVAVDRDRRPNVVR